MSGTEAGGPITGNIQLSYQGVEPMIYSGNLEDSYQGFKFNGYNQVLLGAWNYYNQDYTEIKVTNQWINMYKVNSTLNQYSFIVLSDGFVDIGNGKTGITFSGNDLVFSGLVNAQGDAAFTRQIVQKNDGTLGYEPKDTPFKQRNQLILSTNGSSIGEAYYTRNDDYALITINITGVISTSTFIKITDERQSGFGTFTKVIQVVATTGEIRNIVISANPQSPGIHISKIYGEDDFSFTLNDTILVPYTGTVDL